MDFGELKEMPKKGDIVLFKISHGERGERILPALVLDPSVKFFSIGQYVKLNVFDWNGENVYLEAVPYSPYIREGHWFYQNAVSEEIYRKQVDFEMEIDKFKRQRFKKKFSQGLLNGLKDSRRKSVELKDYKPIVDEEEFPIGVQYVYTVYLDRYRSTGGLNHELTGIYEGQLEAVSTVKGLQLRFWGFDLPYNDGEIYLQPEDKVLGFLYSVDYFKTLKAVAKAAGRTERVAQTLNKHVVKEREPF